MLKRIIALLLLCVLLTSCAQVPAFEEEPSSSRPETSGSENYTLSVNPETCTVSVQDKAGNVVLSTNPDDPQEDEFTPSSALNNLRSQLVVTYYSELNVDATIGSYLSCVKNKTFTIMQKGDSWVRIDYDFSRKNEQFVIPVEYRLEDDCLQIRVLTDEIREYGTKRISRISVTPYMLRGSVQDSGYLLLPDGSGATVDFSYINPDADTYSAQIYGHNPGEALYYEEGNSKSVLLPVFGADYKDYSVLAKVDGNAGAGWINASAAGSSCSYAFAYASFDYRVFDTVTITGQDWQRKEYVAASELVESEDFSVSYYIVPQGGLSALAEKCRETIHNLPQEPEKALNAVLYAYGLTTQRAAFLGIPYTQTVTATSFSDVSTMLDRLSAADRSLAVLLQDFDEAALNADYPSNVKWSGDCGGKKGFEALSTAHPSTDFYCVENLLYKNCDAFVFAQQSQFAKMVSRDDLTRYIYSPVTYAYEKTDLYGLRLPQLIQQAEKALEKAQSGSNSVALRYFGSELYGDYSDQNGTSRSRYLRAISSLLERRGSEQRLAVEGGNDYAMGLAALNYNIPVSSSGYSLQTSSVPFLQMVYHGSVQLVSTALNLTDNPQMELLNCIASGTVPCFAVTAMSNEDLRRSEYKSLFGTCFETQEEAISSLLERTQDYYNAIYHQHITAYEYANGMSVTTFEDGTRAVVNFTQQTVRYEGRQIHAMDFEIIRK